MNVVARNDEPQAVVQLPAVTPMSMIERAVEKGADVAMIEKLMELAERHDKTLGRRAFDQAIAAAKAKIPAIKKNRKVDYTSTKGRTNYAYEDLAEIARTVDPILSEFGLNYRFRTRQEGRIVTVTCILSHRDGYSEETSLDAPADEGNGKNNIQAIGSTVTFLQRYTLKAALGLSASEDDDARRADAVQRINADQFFALQGLIEQTNSDVPGLLKYLRAESLDELTMTQFDTAMSALRKKIKQAEGKA